MLFQMVDFINDSGNLGRTNFIKLRKEALVKQNELHLRMMEVVKNSGLPGVGLVLQFYRKPAGNWSLRWRQKIGGSYKYITWQQADSITVENMNLEMQNHFRELNNFAKEANILDSILQNLITNTAKPYSKKFE